MPDYSFASLSPYEFEHLVRDLLQEEHRAVFESFTPGPDRGCDARWIDVSTGTTIVQCKHYLQTGYAGLLRALREEAPRMRASAPERYVLATSLGLTPRNKDEIRQLFAPHCRSPADVLGRDDLNNRLGLFPQVEQRHLKLWLTSDAVLSRVLEARIFGASATTLERARRKTQRYVMNPSFGRAIDMLERGHVCVVAGIPGIGKTTLAEVLLAHYVDRHDFQPFRVTRDLAELDGVRRRNVPQIFYYDDFLGSTGLDALGKNEDRRLLEFMQEVRANSSWRFVLTTREYVLAAAQGRYETLARAPFEQTSCVIALEDYSKAVRAQILYNHLYFSDLPASLKEALLPGQIYRRVYSHPHYNPRIVEAMTSVAQVTAGTPAAYAAEFIAALDDPSRIWRHAYEQQLSAAARNLLLVRGTLPQTLLLDDLRVAFTAFHESRRARYGYAMAETDFRNALKALDGTFLRTFREHQQTLVAFHNPSVQDFIERRLSEEPVDVRDLAAGGAFLEQYRSLWHGRGGFWHFSAHWTPSAGPPADWPVKPVRYLGVGEYRDVFVEGLARVIEGPTCYVVQYRFGSIGSTRWDHYPVSLEARVYFALDVASGLGTDLARGLARTMLDRLATRLEAGHCSDRDGLIRLLKRVGSGEPPGETKVSHVYVAGRRLLVTQLDSLEDYQALASFMEADPSEVTEEERSLAHTGFMDLYPDEVSNALGSGGAEDADWVRGTADQLSAVADALGVDLTDQIADVREHADLLEGPGPDEEEGRHGGQAVKGNDSEMSVEDIDRMFDGLRTGDL